jgi:hypothetical protein
VLVDGYGYSESDLYLHLNCGWDGFDDAWYCPPAIETSSYSFTAIHTLIFNIFPQQTGSLCTGRVLSPAGRPLARVSVSLKTWRGVVRSVETDEQGIYAFVAAPGTYTLEASAPSLRASASVTVAKTTGTRLLAGGYGEYYAYPDPSIGNVYGQELVMREIAPPQTSATPVAVPYAWLETHYPTPGQTEQGYERLALADTDGDGFPAWQEYAANTDPTDARSKLLCEISLLTDGTPVVTVRPETAREGYPRQLQGKTSLDAASWVDLAAPSRLYRFYRVTVPAASAVR